jgi:hypothetical protein
MLPSPPGTIDLLPSLPPDIEAKLQRVLALERQFHDAVNREVEPVKNIRDAGLNILRVWRAAKKHRVLDDDGLSYSEVLQVVDGQILQAHREDLFVASHLPQLHYDLTGIHGSPTEKIFALLTIDPRWFDTKQQVFQGREQLYMIECVGAYLAVLPRREGNQDSHGADVLRMKAELSKLLSEVRSEPKVLLLGKVRLDEIRSKYQLNEKTLDAVRKRLEKWREMHEDDCHLSDENPDTGRGRWSYPAEIATKFVHAVLAKRRRSP